MIEFIRTEEPAFLIENRKKWTETFIFGGNFNWHNKQKEILKTLKDLTLSHCAFCDDLLTPKGSDTGEIEHFRPKEKYKEFAYEWTNLFPICGMCNGTKNDRFDESLLKPDENDYHFSDWFRIDPQSFILKPKKNGNPNWIRAEITIDLYGLNKSEKIERRIYVNDEISSGTYKDKDKQPFRYL